jgi:hypothetical protein
MVPVVLAIMNLYIIVALSLVCDVYMYIGTILDLLGQELVTPSLIYDICVYTWTILDRLRQKLVTLLATSRPARDPVRQREHCLFDRVTDAVAKFSVFVLFNTVVVMIAYWMAVRRAPLSNPVLPEHCGFFQMMNDECIDLRRAFARLNARGQFGLLLLIRGLRLQNCPVLAVPIAAVQGYQRAFQTSWWRGMRHVGIQMWMANMVFFPLMYMMCWLAPKVCLITFQRRVDYPDHSSLSLRHGIY